MRAEAKAVEAAAVPQEDMAVTRAARAAAVPGKLRLCHRRR